MLLKPGSLGNKIVAHATMRERVQYRSMHHGSSAESVRLSTALRARRGDGAAKAGRSGACGISVLLGGGLETNAALVRYEPAAYLPTLRQGTGALCGHVSAPETRPDTMRVCEEHMGLRRVPPRIAGTPEGRFGPCCTT